jgi:mRNA deadenylase 3'-5' endonuclease subunit Ccr4
MASSHDARVVTYNVLSSSLCEPTYFTHCAPEDLDPDNRYPRMLKKLEAEISAGAVIGLQEVSQKWAGKLHVFFAERG